MSLQNNINLLGIRFFLFGSSLFLEDKFNDIDLLIEYDENLLNIDQVLRLRLEVSEILRKEFRVMIDICLLSKTENHQTQFIKKEKGYLLEINNL